MSSEKPNDSSRLPSSYGEDGIPAGPPGQDEKKATIYDVASEAGVSISTVSRVLNGSDNVAERTRQRVQRVVEDLRFQPDRTARTLAERRRHVLAVAMPSFITPFHNELLKGIRYALQNFECDLLLRDLGSQNPIEELARFLERGAVDGLLVAGVELSEAAAAELRAWRSPSVVIGAQPEGLDAYHWDEEGGAEAATEHLVEQGYQRIGMIRSARPGLSMQERRVEGYRRALKAAGLPYDGGLVVGGKAQKHAGFSEEAGYEAMQLLLAATPPVTAVFASSDVHAMGAWAALRDAGKSVPEDMALVGYDDVKTSQFVGLTSVAQNMHHVGEQAVQRLLFRLEKGSSYTERISKLVRPTLRLRRSSQNPRKA